MDRYRGETAVSGWVRRIESNRIQRGLRPDKYGWLTKV